MLGLLDYSDFLADLKIDTRLQAVYGECRQALITMKIDISAMECRVLSDCLSFRGLGVTIPFDSDREACYRHLGIICEDADTLYSSDSNLWGTVVFFQ